MEINKINFEQFLGTKGIDKTFEDLDVNNDGRITSADMDVAENNDIKNSIANVLNTFDEEEFITLLDEEEGAVSMQKASASGNTTREISARDGISVTDSANYQNDVLNSKGVTYVVMGNMGECSYCDEVERSIAPFKDKISEVANLYNMSWSENTDLCREITYNLGGVTPPAGFPQVAKFVDGKFVSIMPVAVNDTYAGKDASGQYVSISSKNRNTVMSDLVSKLIDEASSADPSLIRNRDGIAVTDSSRFNDDVTQSKGTTYVVMCSGSCGYCGCLNIDLKENLSKIENVANLFSLNWDSNTDLCRKISYEMGNLEYPVTFPVIAKFVDGEFAGIVPDTSGRNTYDKNKIVQKLLDMAEGTPLTKYQLENGAGNVKNTNHGFQQLTSQNISQKANLENKLGGTAYVCLYSPTQAKEATSALLAAGQAIDDANFYYVDSSKDAALCLNLAKQAGYTESTIPYPMLIRYENGLPVEIIHDTTIMNQVKNNNLNEFLEEKTTPFGQAVNDLLNMVNKIPNTSGIGAAMMNAVERDGEKRITHFEIYNSWCATSQPRVAGYKYDITYDNDGTAHITKTEILNPKSTDKNKTVNSETCIFDAKGNLILSGEGKNVTHGFQLLNLQNINEKANLEKIVGGTAYVCLYSPNQAKNATSALISAGQSINDANFYYVDSSKDAELCMNLLKQAGYTENTIPYPMLIRYEGGVPVEIISNDTIMDAVENDSLTSYLDLSLAGNEGDDVISVTEDENHNKETLYYESQKIIHEQKLEEMQKEYSKLEEKLKNVSEDDNTAYIKSKMSYLKIQMNAQSTVLDLIERDISDIPVHRLKKS